MSANDPPDPDFSDSDHAWFERLSAKDGSRFMKVILTP